MRVLMLILGVEFLYLLGKYWELEAFSGVGVQGMAVLFFLCLALDVIKK